MSLDENGKILASYQEPKGKHLKEITSALEYNGHLYLEVFTMIELENWNSKK